MHLAARERQQLPGQAFAARRRIGDGIEQLHLLLAADVAASRATVPLTIIRRLLKS